MSSHDLTSQIETAFANTPRPDDAFDDISATKQDEGIVDYFRGTTWRGHTVRDLRDHSAALSFFTAAAFRYWLPAFMLASLEDAETADVIPGSIKFHMRDGGTKSHPPGSEASPTAALDRPASRYPPENVGHYPATGATMRSTIRFLMRPVSTSRFDERLAQISCYVVALLVQVLGILKLCRLGLDEPHLFFGLLLVLSLTVLCIIGGTLIERSEKAA